MDQTEKQEQQSLSQFMKSQFHRKLLTQLLLLISVFSLFFSYSYWLSLFHSFGFNFYNSLPFQLFSHTINNKCIFLVCNGLLVSLAKNAGLITSSSMYNDDIDDDHESLKSYEDHVPQSDDQPIDLERKSPLLDNEAAALESSTVKAMKNSSTVIVEEEEDQKWGLKEEEEEDAGFVEEDEEDKVLLVADINGESENYDREKERTEENRGSSTEELNKRFDEFIAKMREELKVEARQHLVMV